MKLGLFLETILGNQIIEVYDDWELVYNGLSRDCNINPEKVVLAFFSVSFEVISVHLDADKV